MLVDSAKSFQGRVVLIGDANVGKTSLLGQLMDHRFSEDEPSTVGANYQIYVDEIDRVRYEIQIWDTAGQEKFQSLGPIYFRNALGAVAVYDITDLRSFERLDSSIQSFKNVAAKNPVVFIVGNKVDAEADRRVSQEQGKEFADCHQYEWRETSAKTGQGVEDLFHDLARALYKQGVVPEKPAVEMSLKKADDKCC